SARERLADQGTDASPAVGVGAGGVVVVGRLGQLELGEHQLEGEITPQRPCRLCPLPSAKALIRFWIASSSSSSWIRARSSSSRLSKTTGSDLRLRPFGLGASASGPPSR